VDAPPLGLLVAVQDHVPADVGEIEGFPPFDSALAAGQGEQRLDEAFLLITPLQGRLAG
jgi:hypothetical protein